MFRSLRPLVTAVAGSLIVGVGAAAAQTVIVSSVPVGAPVEVTMAGTTVGTATANALGDARIDATLVGPTEQELILDVHLDSCAATWRVVLNVHGLQPAPPSIECVRKDVAGPFVIRKITTLVVEPGDPPTIKIKQGPPPEEWLRHDEGTLIPVKARGGFSIFAGGGASRLTKAVDQLCGDAAPCNTTSTRRALSLGGVYWFTPYLGAEVAYNKPAGVTANGTGTNVQFKSGVTSNFLAVTANGGFRVRRLRLYGQFGMDYHQAVTSTTQTIGDTTATLADGTVETFTGGTQTFAFRTGGWGVMYGAGMEVWFARMSAAYAQFGLASIKGKDLDGGQATIDDHEVFLVVGVRLHLFGGGRQRIPNAPLPAAAK